MTKIVRDITEGKEAELAERHLQRSASSRLSYKALYLRVRDALVERIANGDWKPGSAILNEVDLAREIGVSGGTVGKALKLMEAEGLVTRRRGAGVGPHDPVGQP